MVGPAAFPLVMAGIIVPAFAMEQMLKNELNVNSLFPLSMLLYTKLAHDRILENVNRGRIFRYISTNPGDHCTSISQNLDLSRGTLMYHLRRLESEELVRSRPDGTLKRYYPASIMIPRPRQDELTRAQRSICIMIEETPGISQMDIASVLGISTAAVNNHVEALLEKGAVRRERVGMRYRYYLLHEGEPRADTPAAEAATRA